MKSLQSAGAVSFVWSCILASSVCAQNNLLTNGNFELGNTGFSSGYTNSPGNITAQGTYDVVANPHNDHPSAASFPDHTTGSGLMLAVNGGADPAQVVWSETIQVVPNRPYELSGWGASWGGRVDPAPARLAFYINGVQEGPLVQLPATSGIWQNFTSQWNSQSSTQAVIEIHDLTTDGGGNDFSLDDLIFAPLATNSTLTVNIYNSVEISWDSVSNKAYQVQWTASLPGSNWFNLGAAVSAVSTNSSVWDRASSGARFYRVLAFE